MTRRTWQEERQFLLEDHPVRHSYHHLPKVRAALAQRGAFQRMKPCLM